MGVITPRHVGDSAVSRQERITITSSFIYLFILLMAVMMSSSYARTNCADAES